MTTAQNTLITLVVDGRSFGVFETLSGGEVSAEVVKSRPGGMAGEKSHAVLPTYGDVVAGRELDLQRDLELYRSLLGRTGRAPVSASKQYLDENGAPVGRPLTYTGRLSNMTDPEADSASTDLSTWQLTFVCTGRA